MEPEFSSHHSSLPWTLFFIIILMLSSHLRILSLTTYSFDNVVLSVILCAHIYSGFSRHNLCINRRYLYSFYITTCFGRCFWPSSGNIYTVTLNFLRYSPFHRPMFTFGEKSCVLHTVQNASYRLTTYKYNIYKNLIKCIKLFFDKYFVPISHPSLI
jgi:hypothetical protein